MLSARVFSGAALLLGACASHQPSAQSAQSAPGALCGGATAPAAPAPAAPGRAALPAAAARMLEPGPEARELAKRAGRWSVVATFRASPSAPPMITKGLVAEREMVGLYLQEVMKPAAGAPGPDFRRISYLTYSRIEGRYQFVSLDTRMPVGIMPAASFGKEKDGKLVLIFEPLAFTGMGAEIEGHMVRSNYVLSRDTEDHDVAQQYWVQSDGSEQEWLAVEYDYTRERTTK